MKQRPILFSTPMVQAIRKGTKTQTRRTADPQPTKGLHTFISPSTVLDGSDRTTWIFADSENFKNDIYVKCPYGQPGDVLWVKETFYAYGKWVKNGKTKGGIQKYKFVDLTEKCIGYRYENCKPNKILNLGLAKTDGIVGWFKRPSLFMPKDAARIWLKITNVRLEQLHDISRDDARAEGIERDPCTSTKFKNYVDGTTTYNERTSFYSLWESINGEESLLSNPFVWVIEFEEIEKPD